MNALRFLARLPLAASFGLTLLAVPGCVFPGMYGGPGTKSYGEAMASAQKSTDDRQVEQLEAARAKVKANPGSVDDARALAQQVLAVYELGVVKRKGLDG